MPEDIASELTGINENEWENKESAWYVSFLRVYETTGRLMINVEEFVPAIHGSKSTCNAILLDIFVR